MRYNACTGFDSTEYYFSMPTKRFDEVMQALFSQIFEQTFDQNEVIKQRSIISDERKGKEPFYPGNNSVTEWCGKNWINNFHAPLELTLGSDDSLEEINSDNLRKVHSASYFGRGNSVVACGNFDPTRLQEVFSKVVISESALPRKEMKYEWFNKDVAAFFDVMTRFEFWVGNFGHETPSLIDSESIEFIVDFLINPKTGIWYKWLRYEKGWAYHVDSMVDIDSNGWVWKFMFPVSSFANLSVVKRKMWGIAKKALHDRHLIESNVERLELEDVYCFQTILSRVDMASESVIRHGRVITQEESIRVTREATEPEQLSRVFETYFVNENMGSMLIGPK